jgi:hypothetical protein
MFYLVVRNSLKDEWMLGDHDGLNIALVDNLRF